MRPCWAMTRTTRTTRTTKRAVRTTWLRTRSHPGRKQNKQVWRILGSSNRYVSNITAPVSTVSILATIRCVVFVVHPFMHSSPTPTATDTQLLPALTRKPPALQQAAQCEFGRTTTTHSMSSTTVRAAVLSAYSLPPPRVDLDVLWHPVLRSRCCSER